MRRLVPPSYRVAFAHRTVRPLLAATAVSYIGDGMSAVTIAWLALQVAPPADSSLFVGAALAAYSLPAVAGTFLLNRLLNGRSPRALVLADCALRAGCLGAIAWTDAAGVLSPGLYLGLLAGSSLMSAWGVAGRYTQLSDLVGHDHLVATNSVISALGFAALVVGPAIAGALIGPFGPGRLIGVDAATFIYLGVQSWRTSLPDMPPVPVERGRPTTGLRLIRDELLLGVLAFSWIWYFLYGPVEVALPLYVAHDLHDGAAVLGTYWALFGVGAVVGSLGAAVLNAWPPWPTTLAIAAGWGLCLLPFGFPLPVETTMAGLALGGVIYGPFTPLTYALFQARTPKPQMATVLAARGAIITMSTPLGTALGGPLTAMLGPSATIAASGAATVALVVITTAVQRPRS